MTSTSGTFAFRKRTRSKTRRRVQLLNDASGELLAVTKDVSDSGLGIDRKSLARALKVGETFDVRLPHRDDLGKVRVVRNSPQTIGLAFV